MTEKSCDHKETVDCRPECDGTATERVRAALFEKQDAEYRAFFAGLVPNVPVESIIGVRTPDVRALARRFAKDTEIGAFLADLPHTYYEENNLHGFILSLSRDFDAAVAGMDALLPYVDNWATCDSINPVAFQRNRARLLPVIDRWLASGREYTVRFAIEMLMNHYLGEDFSPEHLDRVAAVRDDAYYVRMMVAWYFASALTKQWDAALPYIEQRKLEPWVHRKTIQKAIESHAISDERKAILRGLRQ